MVENLSIIKTLSYKQKSIYKTQKKVYIYRYVSFSIIVYQYFRSGHSIKMKNSFNSLKKLNHNNCDYKYYSLEVLEQTGIGNIQKLPVTVKILLEQTLRKLDNFKVKEQDVENLANWTVFSEKIKNKEITKIPEIPFSPSRIILQDFTGVPSLVDLASLRNTMARFGANPDLINPQVPVDLIIDHSIQVDFAGSSDSAQKNINLEFERNEERYKFLKWGEKAFNSFKVYPPGAGIIHQINLEHLASVVHEQDNLCYPDTLVGTDSHTTMINGLGILGWGVGGIEAESAMLGQPIYIKIPEVVGFKIKGNLKEGVTSTDLVLRVTEILRKKGVVEKFIEFFGSGLSNLSVADRATISNMSPEYGATASFFPVDQKSLEYLEKTGRSSQLIELVRSYCKEQGVFRTDKTVDPTFVDVLELDLTTIEPSIAGPKRPQDRIALKDISKKWGAILEKPILEGGYQLKSEDKKKEVAIIDSTNSLKQGFVVLAAITSCTNTSNPSVMLAAGIVAKNAIAAGLNKKEWVKTSLAPGSKVVTDYLSKSGLQDYLNQLGFYTVGYGCTTCIGNSGPLDKNIVQAIREQNLVVTSVLSGNRNFEGRIHGEIKANFLASPPLVVAYSIAGRIDIDFEKEPLGKDKNGKDIFLKDIWPSNQEIADLETIINPAMYRARYQVQENTEKWNSLQGGHNSVYEWDTESTYIQNPPFFNSMTETIDKIKSIENARLLLKLGDSVTTDHISPAGAFTKDTPAGKYLVSKNIDPQNFNSYGSRRGNDKIMTRGTFANIRIKNQLAQGTEGGFTTHFPSNEVMSVYDAAQRYKEKKIPLIVIAGKEYGTGSSRDWAAKGTFLLGIRAVIATSFERIHRSNLIGMGVLPLQFLDNKSADDYGIEGCENFSIAGLNDDLTAKQKLILKFNNIEIPLLCRLDTPVELEYYKNGGILHTVLRNFIKNS